MLSKITSNSVTMELCLRQTRFHEVKSNLSSFDS